MVSFRKEPVMWKAFPCHHALHRTSAHIIIYPTLNKCIFTISYLTFFAVSGVFLIAFSGVLAIVRAARTLHKGLLANILKNPMSFFDTTPKGRIINRFSKDIDTLDDQLRTFVLMLLFQQSAMVATIVAICYSTPLFIAVAIVLAALFLGLQVSSYPNLWHLTSYQYQVHCF